MNPNNNNNNSQKQFLEATKLKLDFANALKDSLKSMASIRAAQEHLEGELHAQEIGVNTAKTITTVGTIGSTVLLFTPFFMVGIGGLVASGAGGIATTAGDMISNHIKGKTIDHLGEQLRKDGKNQKGKHELVEYKIKELADTMKMDVNAANQIVVSTASTALVNGINATMLTVENIPNIIAFTTAVKSGATAAQAMKLATTTTTVISTGARASVSLGTGIAASMEGQQFANAGGQTVVSGVTSAGVVVSKAAVVLSVVGSIVSVADCVYSWINGNPKRTEVNTMIGKIDGILPNLKMLAKQLGIHTK